MIFDIPQRVFIVKIFYRFASYVKVKREFQKEYPRSNIPSNATVSKLIKTFESTGKVGLTPARPTKKNEKQVNALEPVKNLIEEFPSLSIRKTAQVVGVSTKIVFNILHDDLHLKPFKLQQWHKLEFHDYAKRLEFSK